jgi:ankyrin repeat protein
VPALSVSFCMAKERKSVSKAPDDKDIELPVTEEMKQNIASVTFSEPVVKYIISPHSGSLLSEPEPHIELADTIEKIARDAFNAMEEENGHTGKVSREKIVEMLISCGYDLNREIITQIIEKRCPEIEIDERGWLTFLERFQAPGYYYGQRLRQYCGRGQVREASEILCRGCDVNSGDGEGLTSLHYAAEANYPEVIEALAQLTGSRLLINAQDKYGWTPLHSACHHGTIDCVKLLIKLGANVHLTERVGKTPLHLAVAQVRG